MLNEQLNCRHIVRESNYNIWTNEIPHHKTLNLEKGRALSVGGVKFSGMVLPTIKKLEYQRLSRILEFVQEEKRRF